MTEKPEIFTMSIHTGMLESLGINMYTTIGKSLVEFIANGFDAEATLVKLTIPFDKIEEERQKILKNRKQQNSSFSLENTLPESIEITIEDNGHGMTANDIVKKFLSVNRNRRKEDGSDRSENGLRKVMGRKGLGKLAGFGVAEQVIVYTKRKGETYSTKFVMDFKTIETQTSINDVKFIPEYVDGLDADTHQTIITLKKLRCDSFKSKKESISETLAQNFYITGNDFKILLNGEEIAEPDIDYEFTYPNDPNELDENGFGTWPVKVYDGFEYPILYNVKFRARANDSKDGKIRGSMPAYMRGARVYCNQRLAAGPSLFNLETGMHNFHSQSYMECVIHADVLDQQEADLIGTNRSGLKTDNEIIDAFVNAATEIMKKALFEHSKFRDAKVNQELEENTFGKVFSASLKAIPIKMRDPAKKLLRSIGVQYGVGSEEFNNIAPLVLDSINAGEVLVKLIELGTHPKELKIIAQHLTDLASIEQTDVLKVYRGRKNAIDALIKLTQEGEDQWIKGKRTENELQKLFKENPWLIKVEFSRCLTSDEDFTKVISKLARELKIDKFSHLDTDQERRPDLVFLMSDTVCPNVVTVVELKSPNIPLESKHLDQLKDYMSSIEGWLATEFPNGDFKVNGILIGAMPDKNTQARAQTRLLYDINNNNGNKWSVFGLHALLEKTRREHVDIIEAIEKLQKDEEGEEIQNNVA